MPQYEKVVTLGTDCTVGLAMNAEGLKEETYPFDWVVSHFKFLRSQIESGLNWEVREHNLVPREGFPHIREDHETGIFYFHDFSNNPGDGSELEGIALKYRRRSERLRKLMESGNPILFLRTYAGNAEAIQGGTSEDFSTLASLIEERFPACNFTIHMLYSAPGDQPSHDKVIRYKLPEGKDSFRKAVRQHLLYTDYPAAIRRGSGLRMAPASMDLA